MRPLRLAVHGIFSTMMKILCIVPNEKALFLGCIDVALLYVCGGGGTSAENTNSSTTYAPASNSANWITVNSAKILNNNYQFTIASSMNCTAYQNSDICVFAKSIIGQVAGGSCQKVKRIY